MAGGHILLNTKATIDEVFSAGYADTDPISILIKRADGTTLIGTTAVKDTLVAGRYFYVLAPQATLEQLTITWTGTWGGTSQSLTSYAEIVGGHVFTVAQARKRSPFDDTTAWPDSELTQLRVEIEDDLERTCGLAFRPRFYREKKMLPRNSTRIWTSWRSLRAVRALSVGTSVYDAGQLAALEFGDGWIENPRGWRPIGTATQAVISYEHGLDSPPMGATEAALQLAAATAPSGTLGGIDPRTVRIDTQDGSIVLARPSEPGSYGIPYVDRFVKSYPPPLVG